MNYFRNEPFTDFTLPEARSSLADALTRLDSVLAGGPLGAGPVIGGRTTPTAESVLREDPADDRMILGKIGYATVADVEAAVRMLSSDQASAWCDAPADERAAVIERVGQNVRDRRADLAALVIRETGKPWREADADVAEAIDFCFYYADEARRLGGPHPLSSLTGEENVLCYAPRGVTAVIPPWNFPLAIPCGMTVASLVTGNPTVLKPAEQSSLVAAALARAILDAGVPDAAFAFLPGRGEVVGARLASHPSVTTVAFTGSRDVGLSLLRSSAGEAERVGFVRKVVAEMGGKNAIIVDSDADADEAVRGVLTSAFGYAGQKCSACSRLIVVGDSYDGFVARLVAALGSVVVGPPADPATMLGPVIDREAKDRIEETIASAAGECALRYRGGHAGPGHPLAHGHYVPPALFVDVPTGHSLWREEVFGPVLSCRRARTFEEAVALADDSAYALTGGVYSRHPGHIAYARRKLRVGNLYINRPVTGALVGRQPFGGSRLSGVGAKAGGPDYLLQFCDARVVTENTVRRGFVPDER